MSISRGTFLRALIGAPFAAKAVERLISNGVAAPAAKIVPVVPTVPPDTRYPIDWSTVAMSGSYSTLMLTGVSSPGAARSGLIFHL